jgi:hypothetical protein
MLLIVNQLLYLHHSMTGPFSTFNEIRLHRYIIAKAH